MKKFYLLLSLIISNHCFSQHNWSALQIGVQRSWHGSGDFSGFTIDAGYDHSFKERLDLYSGITTTIHYGRNHHSSIPEDHSLHFTTAGIQLTSIIQWALIARTDHRFKVGAGPVFRFQSSSLPSVYGTTTDPNVYPEPFYTIHEQGPQNTFAVGYIAAIIYQPRISYRYHIGFKIQFQNDTNGDAIPGIGILVGRFTTR